MVEFCLDFKICIRIKPTVYSELMFFQNVALSASQFFVQHKEHVGSFII